MIKISDISIDQAALVLDNLACVRGHRTLFKGISLQLKPGDLLRIKGANGAGKTSLLRMLCGLLLPSHGEVLWRGQSLARQRGLFGREMLYLGHAAALKDDLSPLENLQDACALGGNTSSRAAVLDALQAAGLQGHERRLARTLSQGQRRRSALARLALSRNAPLWILDEPFNALDTAATAWLKELMETHLQTKGMVVLTSHQEISLNGPHTVDLAL